MAANMADLLQLMVDRGASDLHITSGTYPQIRVNGRLNQLTQFPVLTPQHTQRLSYSVLNEGQKQKFEEENELDLSFGIQGLARFRCNVYRQRGAVGCAIRVIPYKIRSFDELSLPQIVQQMADRPKGLILVTGPTGSGKSTTLAAMIDKINSERHEHIMTIAETGHLTFGTLHTNSCAQTMNRIIDVFPTTQQSQVRAQLALVLEGVLSQTLIPKVGGGRVMSLEIMTATPAIRNLIREERIHQVYSAIATGQKFGMQTMNQSLSDLVKRHLITREDALNRSTLIEELLQLLAHEGPAATAGAGAGASPFARR